MKFATPTSAKTLATLDPALAQRLAVALTAPQLALRINDSRNVTAVKNYAEASGVWCEMRDENGFGSSDMPSLTIVDLNTGATVAHVSYNGRVWPGASWKPDAKPLYEPGRGLPMV